MTDSEHLRLMIYQHTVQLTVAGEDVSRAMMIAYDVALIVTDDDLHRHYVESALTRMQRRAATAAVKQTRERGHSSVATITSTTDDRTSKASRVAEAADKLET